MGQPAGSKKLNNTETSLSFSNKKDKETAQKIYNNKTDHLLALLSSLRSIYMSVGQPAGSKKLNNTETSLSFSNKKDKETAQKSTTKLTIF